jgi:hypothetical protein
MSNTRFPILFIVVILLNLTGMSSAKTLTGNSATISATVDGGSYTYVELDIEGTKVWYAVPAAEFKIGEKVIAPTGMAMKNFYSKTLDRTFETVYFAESLKPTDAVKKKAALPTGHPPIQSRTAKPTTVYDFSAVKRPTGGKTVEEIHQESATLKGETVTVRGIAVKVTNGIMGKNWIHLRDGSGKSGSNDLTVTTTNSVLTGKTITLSGILTTDRDFGSGYQYAILLEEATVLD